MSVETASLLFFVYGACLTSVAYDIGVFVGLGRGKRILDRLIGNIRGLQALRDRQMTELQKLFEARFPPAPHPAPHPAEDGESANILIFKRTLQ